MRFGGVARAQGRVEEADASIGAATKLVEGLRADGDITDATSLAMAAARIAQAQGLLIKASHAEAIQKYRDALDILKPMMALASVSKKASMLAANAFLGTGIAQGRLAANGTDKTLIDAIQNVTHVKEIARELKASDLTDLTATELYLRANVLLGNATYRQGKPDETTELAKETSALANRLLKMRPDYRPAMQATADAASNLADIDYDNGRVSAALIHFKARRAAEEKLVALDTSNSAAWNSLFFTKTNIADALRDVGRISESLQERQEAIALADQFKLTPIIARNFARFAGLQAMAYQEMGYAAEAEAALEKRCKFAAMGKTGDNMDIIISENTAGFEALVMQIAGKHGESRLRAQQILATLKAGRGKLPPSVELEQALLGTIYRASYAMGDYAAAEAAARQLGPFWKQNLNESSPSQFVYYDSVARTAKAAARQGKLAEAWEMIQPAMQAFLSKRLEKSEDQEQRVARCNLLLTAALANPAERKNYLARASALFATLSPEIKRWRSFAVIGEEIAQEMAK